jgi:hypothetical protein
MEVSSLNPSIIWDLGRGKNPKSLPFGIDSLKNTSMKEAISLLERYKDELQKERVRQSEIKEKYGIRSLEHLILELDRRLIEYYDKKQKGENVDIVIRNFEERKRRYESALLELKDQIQKEKDLTMSMPKFIGAISVSPGKVEEAEMSPDLEIEKIGMEISMRYERENGRKPEDVSKENLGFDIRSTDPKGNVRYIEVKARADIGSVSLTQNEWFKARRFKERYYLYVVFNAKDKPKLYIVQNPAENLKADEKVVRYIVLQDELKVKAHKV